MINGRVLTVVESAALYSQNRTTSPVVAGRATDESATITAQQKRGKLRLVSQLNGEIATTGRLDLSPRRQQRESSVISSPLNVTQSLVDNVTNWVQFPPPARRARSDGRCLRIEILAVRDLPDKSIFGAQSPLVAVLNQPTGEQVGATEPARGAGCNATWGKTSKNVISLHLTHADTGIVLEVCPLARPHARTPST